jgi:hypothetical protein
VLDALLPDQQVLEKMMLQMHVPEDVLLNFCHMEGQIEEAPCQVHMLEVPHRVL